MVRSMLASSAAPAGVVPTSRAAATPSTWRGFISASFRGRIQPGRVPSAAPRRDPRPSLLAACFELIEVRLGIGLRPEAHLARVLVGVVGDLPQLLPVQVTFHLV